jgi:hypothetical protein
MTKLEDGTMLDQLLLNRRPTNTLGVPEIVVTPNDVTVCGVRVERPSSIAPSQWLAFWRRET